MIKEYFNLLMSLNFINLRKIDVKIQHLTDLKKLDRLKIRN